jgi:3',5'-cyclic AMP phosphodiesterase CpdA
VTRTLLHCSDVHFGPPHRSEVAAGLLALIEARRPDLAVVSGDLTQRAKPEQFRAARRFVDRIPVPSLVVPGNHDVPMYRVWERVASPFGAYRRHFSPELEPTWRDEEMLVVGVNTAFNWTVQGGRITARRLGELARQLAAAPAGLFKVVVAHHQLIPPPAFGDQKVLRNARRAVELLAAAGVDLVLSGHLHRAWVGSSEEFYPSGRPPVLILHSGTSTSSRGRGCERGVNTCNWIRVDAHTVLVAHWRWQPSLGRFAEQSRHLYPRRDRSPYMLEDAVLPAGI